MSALILPPRLNGNTRATIELRIEAILLTNFSAKQRIKKSSVKVFVRWWGQALSDGIYFSPRVVQSLGTRRDSSPASKGIRVAIYKVVTGKKRFSEYLGDAERLFLELHANDGDDKIDVVGYSIFERLQRLVDASAISEDLDIFDENGSLIGKLRCQLFYEPVDSNLPDSSENSRNDDPKSVSERLEPQSIIQPRSTPHSQEAVKASQKPKVTFSERNLEFPPSTETDSIIRARSADSEQVCEDQNFTKKFQDFLISKKSNSNADAKENKAKVSKRPTSAKSSDDFVSKISKKPAQFSGKQNAAKTKDFVPYQSVPATKIISHSRAPARENIYVNPMLTSKNKSCSGYDPTLKSSQRRDFYDPEIDDALQTTLNETFEVDFEDNDNIYNVDRTRFGKGGKSFDDDVEQNGMNRYVLKSSKSRQDEVQVTNERHLPNSENQLHSNEIKTSETAPKVSFGRWKLNDHRLREVQQINQFVVRVRKIQFNQNFFASFLTATGNSRFDRRPPPIPVSSSRAGSTEQQKMSFFVNFSIPPRGEVVTCCSLKRDKSRPNSGEPGAIPVLTSRRRSEPVLYGKNQSKPVSSDVEFDSKILNQISFNESMLDVWFTQNLIFRIHSRSLNQRVPTYIGESSFALKHLLITDRYSSGQPQKIPIYISNQLVRELSDIHQQPATYEIIGDLFVDFSFICSNANVKRSEPSLDFRVKEPEIGGKKIRVKDSSQDKVVIASRGSSSKGPGKPTATQNAKPTSARVGESKPVLLSLLLISDGRDFLVRDPSVRNLFVSCRFLGSGSLLTSEICWDTKKPNFRFRHSIPLELDDHFLENCCKTNFLILEVWSLFKPKDKLVGVATIPLHQIYVAYKNPRERDLCLTLELPVIAVDSFIDVRDVLSGDVVGAIRCAFAVGKEPQIVNFLRRFQGDRTGYLSESWSRISASESNPETEKHFDDNFAQTSVLSTPTSDKSSGTSKKTTTDKSSMTVDQNSSAGNFSLPTKIPKNPVLKVSIEEARNLPRIKTRDAKHRLPPNAYVSLPNFRQPGAAHLPVSSIVVESCCPVWSFSSDVDIPKDFFADSNHHLIVKVWHCPFPSEVKPTSDKDKDDVTNLNPDFERDPIIGFVAVDLSPLTLHQNGFDTICGWYNVMDFVGRCRGQVKLSVRPVNLREIHNREAWTCLDLSSDEDTCLSHRNPPPPVVKVTEPKSVPVPEVRPNPLKDQDSGYKSKQSEPEKEKQYYWNPPEMEVDSNIATKSFLASKLSDLTNLADRLRAKLNQPQPEAVTSSFETSKPVMTSAISVMASSVPQIVTSSIPPMVTSSMAQPEVATPSLTPNFVPRSSVPQPIASSFGDFSFAAFGQNIERLVELSEEDEDSRQRGDLLTFSVSPSGSESDPVAELADINWSVVSPESVRDYEKQKRSQEETQQRRSRMAPDGGNPLEDIGQST